MINWLLLVLRKAVPCLLHRSSPLRHIKPSSQQYVLVLQPTGPKITQSSLHVSPSFLHPSSLMWNCTDKWGRNILSKFFESRFSYNFWQKTNYKTDLPDPSPCNPSRDNKLAFCLMSFAIWFIFEKDPAIKQKNMRRLCIKIEKYFNAI